VQGHLTLRQMQGWMLQLYPFIHTFPKYLAETLIKAEDDYSRSYYINNIRVEKAHARHWLWMGVGFGLPESEMLARANGEVAVLGDVQSLSDWLWFVNTKGSLAEAAAATSFAIEGVTGDLARKIISGFEHYKNEPGVNLNAKTYRWMREHVHYDDQHPRIALEIIEHYAKTEQVQRRAMFAAKRSLQLLDQALTSTCKAYSNPLLVDGEFAPDRRSRERRSESVSIDFPERRFRDRRGFRDVVH